MSEESHVPFFQFRDANERADRAEQKYIAAQVKLDKHTMRQGVDDALRDLPETANVSVLKDFLQKSNLRTDGDRAIIDYKTDDGRTIVVQPIEAIGLMQASETHANLFHVERPKEPSAQEKRAAEIKAMPMDQFLRDRKRPGFYDPQ